MARAALYDFALGYIVIAGRRGPLGRRLGGEREPSTTAVDRRSTPSARADRLPPPMFPLKDPAFPPPPSAPNRPEPGR